MLTINNYIPAAAPSLSFLLVCRCRWISTKQSMRKLRRKQHGHDFCLRWEAQDILGYWTCLSPAMMYASLTGCRIIMLMRERRSCLLMSRASPYLRSLVILDTVDIAPTSIKMSQSLDREHGLMPVVNMITQNSLGETHRQSLPASRVFLSQRLLEFR